MALLRALLVSALWFGSTALFAQLIEPPQPGSARHQATGMVVNAVTGEPLPKTLVSLQTPDGQSAAFTDATGHFSIDNVPDGQYGVECKKPGFFSPGEGPFGSRTPRPEITVSATSEPLTIKLKPPASIVGRVLDEQGIGVEGLRVQLLLTALVDGRKRLIVGRSESTDEDGNYALEDVLPGSYRLCLNMHAAPPATATISQTAQSKVPHFVYPVLYFPQATDASSAQPILLEAGQTEHADFTVTAVPGFRIQGAVSPISGTSIRLEDAAGNDAGVRSGADWRTGHWALSGVPPGTWRIVGQSSIRQLRLWGEQTVNVSGSDITNVALDLQPLSTIPIKLASMPDANATVNFKLFDDSTAEDTSGWQQNDYQAYASASSQAAGTRKDPEFADVRPGHYRLQVQVFGTACLDSVRQGGVDVRREGITVTGGGTATPLETTLRKDCASVQVKVNHPESLRNVFFLLISNDPALEIPPINALSNTASFTASFANLSPGGYHLYAFDSVDQLEYHNPEAMKPYTGQEVTLEANQNTQVTVDLISRSANQEPADEAR